MASSMMLTLVLSLLAIQAGRVRAQSATCHSGWEWMNNTVKLDPCQIARSLDSWCFNYDLMIPSIGGDIIYLPPDDSNSQYAICDCNTPMYSLYAACSACQGAGWVKWSEWSAVCNISHVGFRPADYLVTTPIPHWVFLNVTVNDTFVPEAAKLAGGLPEERADGPTTTFKPSGSTTFLQVQSSSMPLSTTSSPSSDLPSATNTEVPKSKTPVGAIAGGTVGGLAALCLIGFGLLFLRKQGSLKIPRIRRASGPMSLFDPHEEAPDARMEEATTVKRPLLYDPTNPATFSQVHAELERPLHPDGGVRGPMGYYEHQPSWSQSSTNETTRRYGGIPEI